MQSTWLSWIVWLAVIRQVSSQCSSVLTQTTNRYTIYTLESPNYPSYYNNYQSCQWNVTASTSSGRIMFAIPSLSIERNYDFMSIYDGTSTSSSRLFYSLNSANQEPLTIVTNGPNGYGYFTSDYSVTYGGFQITYTEVDASSEKCTGTLTASSTEQHAWSTSSSSFGCSLTITATSGNRIKISVLNLVTNSYLRFADSDGSSSTDIVYSGTSEYVSLTSSAVVTVPYLVTSFMFTYKEVANETNNIVIPASVTYGNNVCFGLSLTANSTLQYLSSPNYPNPYSNNVVCYTTINAPSGKAIMIRFVDFDVNYDDNLNIHDGPSESYFLLGNIWSAGETVNSTGSSVYISFYSGFTGTLRGFQLSYREIDAAIPTCASTHTNFTASSTPQQIIQPAYSNNIDVYWLIVKPSISDNIVLDISPMSVEDASNCRYDSITLYDGACTTSPLIATVCGYSPVTFEDSTGIYVLVRFRTDGSVTYDGFTLIYYIGTYVSVDASTGEDDSEDKTRLYFVFAIVAIFLTVIFIAAIAVFCYFKKMKRRRTAIASGTIAASKPKATLKSTHQLLNDIKVKVDNDLKNTNKPKQQRKTPRNGQFKHPEPTPAGPGVKVITRTSHPIHPTPGVPPLPVIQQRPPVVPPPFGNSPVYPPLYETGGDMNGTDTINPAYPPGFDPSMYGKPVIIPEGTIPAMFQYISPTDARVYGLH